MPATKFRCPDGVSITIGECLVSCRLGRRCLTLPTLIKIASSERPYAGVPSTTRLLNGAMMEYLKATTEYTINPKDRAYALLGTEHHAQLAQFQGSWLSEKKQGTVITGTPDIIEPDELVPGKYILTDYKTYGSFRVQKCLGLASRKEKSKTERYVKSGKWGKAGEFKNITTWFVDPEKIDTHDEELQLNHYRLLLEEAGFPISYMQLQITVRDGGIQMARERGVTESIYLVPIPFLQDQYIKNLFSDAKNKLEGFLDGSRTLMPCNDEESWHLRRCQDYCEVAENCTQGQRVLNEARSKS